MVQPLRLPAGVQQVLQGRRLPSLGNTREHQLQGLCGAGRPKPGRRGPRREGQVIVWCAHGAAEQR
eukprot:10627921-Alexandrium_andersonii.AAC.1